MKTFVLCLVALALAALCLSSAQAAPCPNGQCKNCPAVVTAPVPPLPALPAACGPVKLPPACAASAPCQTKPRLLLPKVLRGRKHHILPRRR